MSRQGSDGETPPPQLPSPDYLPSSSTPPPVHLNTPLLNDDDIEDINCHHNQLISDEIQAINQLQIPNNNINSESNNCAQLQHHHHHHQRPVSYPWGPETQYDEEQVAVLNNNDDNVVNLTPKRYSDPSPPSLISNSIKYKANKQIKAQVKPFTKESIERLEKKTIQLVREYGFQPRRKLSVEDGSRLPAKYEPFPTKLYGRPLEEIDNFIYDEVK